MTVQIIEKDGHPEWAVIPFEVYQGMLEELEMQEDLRDLRERVARLETGEVETFPADVALALIHQREPVRVQREHRALTQPQLAAAAGISVPYLSQLESGKRRGSVKVLSRLAAALDIDLDLLV
jgi:ribosome-binding protein aMBF1 (putative translation factor)